MFNNFKNCLAGLMLTISFCVIGNAKADMNMVSFAWGPGNEDVSKSPGLLEALSLTAVDNGSGINFVFSSTYDEGKNNGGVGKFKNDEFYIYGTDSDVNLKGLQSVFKTGTGVSSGGGIGGNGQTYPVWSNEENALVVGNIKLSGKADFTAVTDGFTEDSWQVGFTLDYSDGKSWANFIDILDTFTVAMHLQGLVDGNSAKVIAMYVPEVQGGSNATPEPATLLILGGGLAGLSWAARRRNKNKDA